MKQSVKVLWQQHWRRRLVDGPAEGGDSRKFRELVRHLDFDSESAVLDVGCGSGAYLAYLATSDYRGMVVGTDISHSALQLARVRVHGASEGVRAHFVRCDIDRLPFRSCVFENLVCYSVIGYVPAQDATLVELQRVIRRTGRFVISASNRRNWITRLMGVPTSALRTLIVRKGRSGSIEEHSTSTVELVRQVRGAGLDVEDCYTFRVSPPWPLNRLWLTRVLADVLERCLGPLVRCLHWGDIIVVRGRK